MYLYIYILLTDDTIKWLDENSNLSIIHTLQQGVFLTKTIELIFKK